MRLGGGLDDDGVGEEFGGGDDVDGGVDDGGEDLFAAEREWDDGGHGLGDGRHVGGGARFVFGHRRGGGGHDLGVMWEKED